MWNVAPDSFMNSLKKGKRKCPKCNGGIKRTHDDFLYEVRKAFGLEYTFLEKYKNANTSIKVRHNKCNHVYNVKPDHFLRGRRCPNCFGSRFIDTEIFKNEVNEMTGGEYKVLGEYKNARTKIMMKHNDCGFEWEITPDGFVTGSRCPQCRESQGEQRIRLYLEENHIKYLRQYEFSDCKNIQPLPFDFAILNEGNEVVLLIEYDGEFHYHPIVSKQHLKYQKHNDTIKNNYCKNKNIPLLRIPYWELHNIEKILHLNLNCKSTHELEVIA